MRRLQNDAQPKAEKLCYNDHGAGRFHEGVNGSQFFSKIDLANAYLQIPLSTVDPPDDEIIDLEVPEDPPSEPQQSQSSNRQPTEIGNHQQLRRSSRQASQIDEALLREESCGELTDSVHPIRTQQPTRYSFACERTSDTNSTDRCERVNALI
jgi:hypothetical protein